MNIRNSLATIAGIVGVIAATSGRASAQVADGKALYETNCRKCHGVRGIPPKAMKEKFSKIKSFDAAFVKDISVDSLVKVLTKGKGEDMVSFKDKMTHDEMEAVAKYARDLAVKPAAPGSF
jgi:mono/diheme cytochrome c family protein